MARSRKAPVEKKRSPVGSKKSSVNADLRAMLLALLAGFATSLNCPVRRLLTKICGRLQTPRNCMRVPQSRRAVLVEPQPFLVGSQPCPVSHGYRRILSKSRGNCGSRRPDAGLVRTDNVLSGHPVLKSSVRTKPASGRLEPQLPPDLDKIQQRLWLTGHD